MAESLKTYLDGATARTLGERVHAVHPEFDVDGYATAVDDRVGPLELKDRVLAMAEELRDRLPGHYPDALAVLVASLGAGLEEDQGMFNDGWYLMPVARFVEEFGLDHPEVSLPALVEITKRHTSEFAVRPYVLRHPEATMRLMHECALSTDHNVRRFASEGIRPRLPWARRLTGFVSDPRPVLQVLEPLRSDPSDYVRRSVANNLNDMASEHPALVLDTAERWLRQSPTPETTWTVRHALRTLIKQGDQRALALTGATGGDRVHAVGLTLFPSSVTLGESVLLRVDVANTDQRAHTVVVDYVVHHRRSDGRLSPKVFKLATVELDAGERRTVEKKHPVRPLQTRTYHPGEHLVEVQVNGQITASASFGLRLP